MTTSTATEVTHNLESVSYKYKLSVLTAIIFPCLSPLLLHGSGNEHELLRYFLALFVGASAGYAIGFLLDKTQKSLHLKQNSNISLNRKIEEQMVGEAWYTTLFEKNHAVFLLIDPTTGMIKKANSSACTYYGYPVEQMKRMHISEIDTLPGKEIYLELTRANAVGRNKIFSRHRLASGELRDVELFSGSIDLNKTSLLFLVVNDITDQKVLRGIIPICAHCKSIRDGHGQWNELEEYIQKHSEASFSHGLCSSCAHQLYPSIYEPTTANTGKKSTLIPSKQPALPDRI